MNTTLAELNLARKLRPKRFGEIIGQQFSVKMLKNSLYLNKLFPVYIFSGQRGCGKTSTARLFGAALNCEKLLEFRQNPKEVDLPCLECTSCNFMQNSNHPDFIEIDAASHTGVDNVRQIIESAAHLPISGNTKIYLIDEAHMLSKAAFNAFLKVLEEPPAAVRFVLATTEIDKIPDTVKSRAFLVFFNSIDKNALVSYLKDICIQESISIDNDALSLIVEESDGSVRDSLNILERVRFLGGKISRKLVLNVLGRISEKDLIGLFDTILSQNPKNLLSYLTNISFDTLLAHTIWDMLIELCRDLLWVKYNVVPNGPFSAFMEEIEELAKKCSVNRLNAIMQLLLDQEEIFFRTSKKHLFLEMILFQICRQVDVADLEDLIKMCKSQDSSNYSTKSEESLVNKDSNLNLNKLIKNNIEELKVEDEGSFKDNDQNDEGNPWELFLRKINQFSNPMLESIFKQMKFISIDKQNKKLSVLLSRKNKFFDDNLAENKEHISKLILETFGLELELDLSYDESKSNELKVVKQTSFKQNIPNSTYKSVQPENNIKLKETSSKLDLSDQQKWPKTHLLVKYFPGRIEQVKDFN